MLLRWLVCSLLSQAFEDRHFRKSEICCAILQRRCFFLAVIVLLPAHLDLSGRIEAEQENDQSEDDRDCAHGLFTCRKSLRQRWRVARSATDSIRRTRRKRPSLSLSRSYLSSRYFLKRSKIDISQKCEE